MIFNRYSIRETINKILSCKLAKVRRKKKVGVNADTYFFLWAHLSGKQTSNMYFYEKLKQ